MLDEKHATNPRGFDTPNDYAFMHGEKFCGACPEGEGSYPHHCLHGSGENLACCWCGDVFVGEPVRDTHGQNFHPLTVRETQVATLIAEGLSNKLIGVKLDIAEHTAKFHVNNVVKKLGKNNRAGAAAEVIRRGIVP